MPTSPPPAPDRAEDLLHIAEALARAGAVLLKHAAGAKDYELKGGGSPVTAADHEVDALLRNLLPRPGDGWLSEETADGPDRLGRRRVWVVDPLDGTRDFLAGRPEYSASIALCEDGVPVLGGICNPATGVTVIGVPEPDSDRRVGTVALRADRVSPGELHQRLAEQGIFTWAGNSYAVALGRALGLEPHGALRVGLLHYNTAAEVDRLLEVLGHLLG